MIKRFDLDLINEESEYPKIDHIESADGQYVEYDDVVELIKYCLEDETVDDIRGNLAEEFGFENHP